MKARSLFTPLALALASSCHAPEQSATTSASAAPSAVRAPSASVSVTARATPPEKATFAVENLLDLKRQGIMRFAYAPETDMLFVSFSDPAKMADQPPPPSHQNELEQWSVGEGRMVFRYELPPRWIFDELFPSPDGRLLGARLFRTGDGSGCKLTVFDVTTHKAIRELGCSPPDRWSTVLFTSEGDFVASNNDPQRGELAGAISGFDRNGHARHVELKSLVREARCARCTVIGAQQGRTDAGLYFTGADQQRRLVTSSPWHDNYALSNSGELLVTTTWDGEVIGWSTAESRPLFTLKWTEAYGYLAYDKKRDRFLLGEVVSSGTSFLRVLARKD